MPHAYADVHTARTNAAQSPLVRTGSVVLKSRTTNNRVINCGSFVAQRRSSDEPIPCAFDTRSNGELFNATHQPVV
jgi:hypothetical protein